MRFALLTSFCAAALCVAATVNAAAQAPLPVSDSAVLQAQPVAAGNALLALNAAPSVSSSSITAAPVAEDSSLPDAPEATLVSMEGQSGAPHVPSNTAVAKKYTGVILPGQTAVPYTAGDKVAYGFLEVVSPFTMASRVLSAGWSHLLDSQPHYGVNSEAFGQRVGASFARGTVQDLATIAVFDPIFHDDPRYYVLGRSNNIVKRAVYAASRVVVTRGDNGKQRVNAPLLLGYAAASGVNMAYYPERDRNFGDAATGYVGSLAGSIVGFEFNEFLDDALRIVHLRH